MQHFLSLLTSHPFTLCMVTYNSRTLFLYLYVVYREFSYNVANLPEPEVYGLGKESFLFISSSKTKNMSICKVFIKEMRMRFHAIISIMYFVVPLKQIFLSNTGFWGVAVSDISSPTSHLYVSQTTRYVLYKSRRKVISFWEFTEGIEVRDGTVAERNRRKRNCVAYSSLHFVFSMYTAGGLSNKLTSVNFLFACS